MREVIDDIERWQTEEEAVALATVIATWGSSPRRPGAKMALTPAGKIAGSVSGGCVEGAVFEAGVEALEQKQARRLHFGVADETAWDVGLACGGEIDIFVEPLDPELARRIARLLREERAGVVATIVEGPEDLIGAKLFVDEDGAVSGGLDEGIAATVREEAARALATGQPRRITVSTEASPVELFLDVILPPPTLIMVGGVHIAIALAKMARALNFRTIIVDPRRAFGSEERFPDVDRLIQKWPREAFEELALTPSTAVTMLTHDPKIDDPALKIVLDSPAYYVGALGSSRTHARRRQRLLEDGVPEELLDRIHAPIGLDIEAQTPEEIAVAVMAEMVAARRQASPGETAGGEA